MTPCNRKKLFETLKEATIAANKMRFMRGADFMAYHCSECKHWHLTSKPRDIYEKMLARRREHNAEARE